MVLLKNTRNLPLAASALQPAGINLTSQLTVKLKQDRQRNIVARSRNHWGRGKAISIKYYECMSILALLIRHAKRTHRIILSSVACLALPYFPHYLINGTIFGKTLLNTECVFRFSLQMLSETFLILRRIQQDIYINVRMSSCNVSVILVRL